MKKRIWAFYMMLGEHMWQDETSPAPGLCLPKAYREEMGTELAAWDEIVSFLPSQGIDTVLIDLGDGVRLDSHPEIAVPNAWSKEFLRGKLDEMRALGLTPIPKLNFSSAHSGWMKQYRRMTSSGAYYGFCREVVSEVCELFGNPELFHLGLDEEDVPNQRWKDLTIVRGEELWRHDCLFLFDCCMKNGARPWIWSDYCWAHPEAFRRFMPKEVVQSNWFYFNMLADGKTSDPPGWETAFRAFEELEALGYDQIPASSTWANETATMQVAAHCRRVVAPERLMGFLTAAWYPTQARHLYTLKNDAHRLALAKRENFPDGTR